jgi:alkylation response protein AidB-like acyl-CoA dehydrogenase
MDLALTANQERWIEKASRLAKEFAPRARAYDEAGEFPSQDFKQLREEGFLGLAVPQRFGGESTDPGACMALLPYLVTRAIAKESSGTAWCYMIHNHQVGTVARLGNDEQGRRILGDVVRNGKLMGSGGVFVNPKELSAPQETGSRPAALTATRQVEVAPGGLIANATSFFCSMAPAADYIASSALVPGTTSSAEGGFQFVVSTDTPGISFGDGGWGDAIGLRSTMTGSTTFKDVFVPWENVIGQPGDFIQKDPYTFELSQAAHLLGTAEGAFDFILHVLRERPYLLKDDSTVYEVGRMESALYAANAALLHTAWLWDKESWSEAALGSLKTLHSTREAVTLISTKGFEIIGTRALMKFHPFERAVRDMQTASLHTRESVHMRSLTEGLVAGSYFPKKKYGDKLDPSQRKTWQSLGFEHAGRVAART